MTAEAGKWFVWLTRKLKWHCPTYFLQGHCTDLHGAAECPAQWPRGLSKDCFKESLGRLALISFDRDLSLSFLLLSVINILSYLPLPDF